MTPRSPRGWRARRHRFPETVVVAGRLAERTRYGENPHQTAAFYRTGETPTEWRPRANCRQGTSYNNYADTDAAFELVAEFSEPAVAIIKHANPCGVAIGANLREAWDRALRCDLVSAWRDCCGEPSARCRDRGGNRAIVRRGRYRAGNRRIGARIARPQAITPPVDTGGMPDPKAPDWLVRWCPADC